MFVGKLCCVLLLLIHHGGGAALQFNVSEDTIPLYKRKHGAWLPIFNKVHDMCRQRANVTYGAVSDGVRSVIIGNNMTVPKELGCYMHCFAIKVGLMNVTYGLKMEALTLGVNVYRATLKPYPRFRAIMSVMVACFMKMDRPLRFHQCDLFRVVIKCVEVYEKQISTEAIMAVPG